ncbi:MAG: metallophosphoesterase family protein, partial [Aristaeellaceae bacterium]
MRCLIVSDIHGNLPALEAVLASPEAAACESIISLGDQVNFGPQSREVLQRLESLHAAMLLGNHEERFTRLEDP